MYTSPKDGVPPEGYNARVGNGRCEFCTSDGASLLKIGEGGVMFLGDFVEQLAAMLQQRRISMPFENEAPWHELFYDLKFSKGFGKPAFFEHLRFDWDGPYPKSAELSEFLHALHWNACVDARNPHFDTITLAPEMANLWSRQSEKLDPDTRKFLEAAVESAAQRFSNSIAKM
jgi:hypothetical protein